MNREEIDLDFARYVVVRRGAADRRARDGAAYAYEGERKVARAVHAARPVTLAIEATVRMWKAMARADLLGSAVKGTPQQFPRVHQIAVECSATLGIPMPSIYVAPSLGELSAHTLGTEDDALIAINAAIVDHLSEDELRFVIGHECGHIQNNHVVFMTALHYLSVSAASFLRWIVMPATIALKSWARRAEITGDRAGLLCTRDLGVGTAAIVKLALGSKKLYGELDMDEYLKQLDEGKKGLGRASELFRSHPYLPKRIEALRLFSKTALYRRHAKLGPEDTEGKIDGLDAHACDTEVVKLLSVL